MAARVTALIVDVLRTVPAPTRVTTVAVDVLRAQGPSEEVAVTAVAAQVLSDATGTLDLTFTQVGVEAIAGGAAPATVTQAGVEAVAGGVAAPQITQEGVEVLYRANFTGCDTMQVYYRVRLYHPETGVPLATFTSLRTGNDSLLVGEPVVEASTLDVLKGSMLVGACTFALIDAAARTDCTVDEDPTDRAVTKLLADALGDAQVLGARVRIDASADDTPTWLAYWTGYVAGVRFVDAITAEFTCAHTTRDDTTAKVWETYSAFFPQTGLLAGGPVLGDFPSSTAGVKATGFEGYWNAKVVQVLPELVRLDINEDTSAAFPPSDVAPFLKDRGLLKSGSNNDAQRNVFRWLERNAQPYFAEGGPTAAVKAAWGPAIAGWYPRLEFTTLTKNGSVFPAQFPVVASYLRATVSGGQVQTKKATISADLGNNFHVYWPAGGAVAQPAVNDVFTFYVRPTDVSPASPLHIVAHPCDILASLWTSRGISFSAGSVTTAKAALGEFVVALRITEGRTFAAAQELLCGAFGLGWRIDPNGIRTLFTTRARPAVSGTLTLDDLVDDAGPVWELDESQRVYSVAYTWQRFVPWPGDEDPANADRALDGVMAYDVGPITFESDDLTQPYGARNETFKVPGCVLVPDGSGGTLPYAATETRDVTARLAEPLLAQFQRGAPTSTLHIRAGIEILEGQDWLLEIAHRPGFDAGQSPVAQRGTSERVQVISRQIHAWGTTVQVIRVPADATPIDDGTEVPTPTPVTLDPTVNATAGSTSVSLVLDDDTGYVDAGIFLEVEYAVQATAPEGSGTAAASLWEPGGSFTLGPFAAGAKVWYRVRPVYQGGARGAWGAWDDVQLTATTGQTGGTGLQTPTIVLGVDGAFLVSAGVDGGPSATKAYLAYSLVGFPSEAAVLAGSVDTVVPFSFAALGTPGAGVTAYVAAITEDALGNRSLRATALYTRPGGGGGGGGPTLLAARYEPLCPPASPSIYDIEFNTPGAGVPAGLTSVGALVPTAIVRANTLELSTTADGGGAMAALEGPIPAGANFTVGTRASLLPLGNFNIASLYVRNFANGRIFTMGLFNASPFQPGNTYINHEQYTNTSGGSRPVASPEIQFYGQDMYLRICYDGTDIYGEWSSNGVNWVRWVTQSMVSFLAGGLTPDRMGIKTNSFSGTPPRVGFAYLRYVNAANADTGREVGYYAP
ncbi:MAG: hypothetical protein V4617_15085 [Gemmatimonadota bacterium]